LKRASENSIGIEVKIADLMKNMDLSRIPSPTEKDAERNHMYSKYLERLIQKKLSLTHQQTTSQGERPIR
jgi:hypothetical protein